MTAMTRFAFRMASLAVAAGLAACAAVGPDYRRPPEALASQPAAAKPFAEAPANAAPLPAHWWRLYHDPLLDRLVTQALAHNTDLRQAVANLERERAIETEVAGAKYPTIGVNGGPSFGHVSGLSLLQRATSRRTPSTTARARRCRTRSTCSARSAAPSRPRPPAARPPKPRSTSCA